MKKITAILFLSIYLFYPTGFHELLKVNILIEHFHETQKNDSALTFYHFLVMHYITDDLNDKDDYQDKQLPFKSTETLTSNITFYCIPELDMKSQATSSFIISNPVKLFAKNLFIEKDFNSSVWHPPKNA